MLAQPQRLPTLHSKVSKMGVPGLNKAMNEVPQVLGGADTGPTQALAAQNREPNLPLVEPRAVGRQPVESHLGPLGGTPVQTACFL